MRARSAYCATSSGTAMNSARARAQPARPSLLRTRVQSSMEIGEAPGGGAAFSGIRPSGLPDIASQSRGNCGGLCGRRGRDRWLLLWALGPLCHRGSARDQLRWIEWDPRRAQIPDHVHVLAGPDLKEAGRLPVRLRMHVEPVKHRGVSLPGRGCRLFGQAGQLLHRLRREQLAPVHPAFGAIFCPYFVKTAPPADQLQPLPMVHRGHQWRSCREFFPDLQYGRPDEGMAQHRSGFGGLGTAAQQAHREDNCQSAVRLLHFDACAGYPRVSLTYSSKRSRPLRMFSIDVA